MRFKSKSDDFHIAFYIAQGYSKETLKKIGLPFGFLVAKKKKKRIKKCQAANTLLKNKEQKQTSKEAFVTLLLLNVHRKGVDSDLTLLLHLFTSRLLLTMFHLNS